MVNNPMLGAMLVSVRDYSWIMVVHHPLIRPAISWGGFHVALGPGSP